MKEETPKNSFFCREKPIFWIFFAVYGIIGLIYAFLGNFWGDENWYFGGSWLVANGQVPYHDFFIHHNPLFFYVYSLPQYLFGPSIIAGRLTSFVLMMFIFVLVWRLARKLGGKNAALISGGLLVTNIFLARYYTTFSYRSLEAFFMLVFFNILFGSMRDTIKYPTATLMLCLVVCARYPVDIIIGMLGLFLIYIIIRSWHQKRVILLSLAAAIVSLGAILLPFIIIAPAQYFFSTVTYSFKTPDFWAEFGVMGIPSILTRVYQACLSLAEVSRTFYAAVAILLGLLIFLIFKVRSEKTKIKDLIIKYQNFVILIAFILLFEVFCAVAYLSSVGLRTLTFPAAVVLAGVGLSKVMAEIKNKSAVWLLNAITIALIVLTPLAQYGQGDESRPALKWKESDLNYILNVSQKIAGYTHKGDRVLTFTPALALQADRELMPGMLMETFNFFPTWDTSKAQKYHLFNESMLLGYLTSRAAAAVVLDNRFFDGGGQAAILDKYRKEISSTLDKNYYLAETLSFPPETGRENVYIYLPRSP
jgi:4-amino-4-deoxy-L-arabinose transferase-like glycosyltransferase